MSLTSKLTATIRADLAKTAGFVTPTAQINLAYSSSLTSGTGTGQANAVHSERYTIAQSGTQVIDLSAITDDLGQSVALTAVKQIIVTASSANAAAVTLKPNGTEGWVAAFNAAADTLKISAGGCVVLANPEGAGWAVVDNTTDKLLLTNTSASASATVDVVIVGVGTVT